MYEILESFGTLRSVDPEEWGLRGCCGEMASPELPMEAAKDNRVRLRLRHEQICSVCVKMGPRSIVRFRKYFIGTFVKDTVLLYSIVGSRCVDPTSATYSIGMIIASTHEYDNMSMENLPVIHVDPPN